MRGSRAILCGVLLLTACAEPEEPARSPEPTFEESRTGCRKPWSDYNKGIRWRKDLSGAFDQARRENKLVFYYLLVGDLDKSHC